MSSAEYRMRYTESYLLESLARYRRQLWWRGQYGALRWVLAVVLALLAGLAFYHRAFLPSIVLGGFLGMLLGAIFFGDPIDAWNAKRRLRKSPFYNNDLTFRISESELHITGSNEDTHLKWSAYSKARRFSDGVLLFQGPSFFNWLPDAAAIDKSSIEQLQTIVRERVKDYRDV
jgi:hypothetical protein